MRSHLGSALGQIAIVIAALVLISLAWLGSFSAITAERDQTEARVEAAVGVEALAFEEQVNRQLLALDQTLRSSLPLGRRQTRPASTCQPGGRRRHS